MTHQGLIKYSKRICVMAEQAANGKPGKCAASAGGKALFQMMGVFAEFERAMIQSRVKAGLQRAQAEQAAGKVRRDTQGRRLKAIGRPKISDVTEAAIRARLASGVGMLKVAHELGVGSGTVQRVKREMAGRDRVATVS